MSQTLPELSFTMSFTEQGQLTNTTFEDAITESIETILSLLGDANKQTIYHHLENKYGIKKEEIPHNIGAFAGAFEQTFGSVAKLIEIKIMESLHAKYKDFSYVPAKEELNFLEFIYNFQQYLEG
jgi:hypothetical protein